MSLALYLDVHVPILISESLRRRGLDILTSQDDKTAMRELVAYWNRGRKLKMRMKAQK